MTTLGQRLKANQNAKKVVGYLSPEERTAREEAMKKAAIESMQSVVAKAKQKITEAILADEDKIEYEVTEYSLAFRFLFQITQGLPSSTFRLLHPIWDEFSDWAKKENLSVRFKTSRSVVEHEGTKYPGITIYATPTDV